METTLYPADNIRRLMAEVEFLEVCAKYRQAVGEPVHELLRLIQTKRAEVRALEAEL